MLQRTLRAGFIAPCLPTKTDKLPSGSQWLHEIKHDGFRVIARKEGPRVRLYSRPDNESHPFLTESSGCGQPMAAQPPIAKGYFDGRAHIHQLPPGNKRCGSRPTF
jgi:hypothetical protein